MAATPLGEFLRSRRAQVTPEQAGLSDYGGRRQVSGLRREELALLAGMSVDYYVRLEQGRERHPSSQILDALATALQLAADGHAHLYRLAGLAPNAAVLPAPEQVDRGLLQLMDMWPDHPALVLGHAYDVLAANRLGEALFSGFAYSRNLTIKVFQDPSSRTFYADWHAVATNTAAGFRLHQGVAGGSPRFRQVLEQLLNESPEFRDVWARHAVRGKTADRKHFVHPEIGALTLRMQSFDVRAAPGQELVVYHAEPGSSSAQALLLLGALAATDDSRRDAAAAERAGRPAP